ncbi:MAG TPA: ATP-binding protein [Acetobacteraceae bacterium]|nr:ATP-binding protein [Acetobacteraceae bacterium]
MLVLAPTGRDGPAAAELLRRAALAPRVCTGLPELVTGLDTDADAVFVAEEALFSHPIDALTAWVEQQPPWSDMPFVVLTNHGQNSAIVSARGRLVSALRNVSLLERPVQTITLTSTIHAAVRARRRQYEVREHLAERNRAARELEGLVAARTSELEAANRELRAQIAERAKVEESLRHAQKLEAIGQLTGGVAHDFNNLLMVISGGIDMLGRPGDAAREHRIMKGMRQAVDRGAALTRQLLAFSRRQALRPEPLDLGRQVGGMRELLDRSLRGDVHVTLDFPDDLWPVAIDPGELELAVLNLAVNARDAMPSGGTIAIRAENLTGLADGDLRGDFVRLTVTDTGTGMTPKVLPRVFEPFFTTKDIGKGSGLGLAQVYGFAKQSGGAVRIDTAVGRGTTVAVLLPRSDASPATVQPHVADFRPAPASDDVVGHVLLVEDDDEVAALVTDMLAQIGLESTRASSAAAALGALADSRKVDLVFSDIMMPGCMNGVDLAREVKRRRPGLPILLTTAYAEAAQQDADVEGIALLPKPYRLEELASVTRSILRRSVGGRHV